MTPPSATEVALIARYWAIAGLGDTVAALLSRHVAATRAEPGCREFTALRGVEDLDSFVLYERYESRAAFDAHVASQHYQGIARDQIRPLLRDRTVEFFGVVEPAREEARERDEETF